jgi:beta-glucosidase-like glycosyl hydrolase
VTPGRLVFPALRWREASGFAHEEEAIAHALAAGVGGFILFGGTAGAVAGLTASLRGRAAHPLLIGADLERGAGQQVTGLTELPPPPALAALGEPGLIGRAGALTAAEARSVGIDWVYAPVADLDLEPDNPIVQTRSFGASPEAAGRAVAAWVAGCQGAGALACAKHFPGHGRTRHDSHDRLPVVDAPADRLRGADLVPFRHAVEAGVASVMTAHVAYPALDPTGAPATVSGPILDILRDELGFDGLVVTDALIMEGARQGAPVEQAAVAAVRAGVDCLLYPPDPRAVTAALAREARLDAALRRRLDRALARLEAATARVAAARPAPAEASLGPALATRLVEAAMPAGLRLRAPLDLVVVDDDTDGAFPAGPSDWVERSLRAAGVPLGAGGSRVVLVFAEPRASKGRGGLGAASRAALARAAAGAALVCLFAHPRLAGQVPAGVPVAPVWHRQRLLQDAVGVWLARHAG